MPQLDWSIPVWSLVGFVGTGVGIYISIIVRIKALEVQMRTLWAWYERQMPGLNQTPPHVTIEQSPPRSGMEYRSIRDRDHYISGYRDS